MITTHNLGFPRIGARRELKTALERYWSGNISRDQLETSGRELRQRHWAWQREAGIQQVPVGDFSFYDHVLDMMLTLGVLPERFHAAAAEHPLDLAFYMARGRSHNDALPDVPALEMTKWFDTNYHYLVPELTLEQTFAAIPDRLRTEIREAREMGLQPKPVLLGPVSFLYLAKMKDDGEPLELLDRLLPAYQELLEWISAEGASWVQIDEPILTLDLPVEWQSALRAAYDRLHRGGPRLLLTTYFGGLGSQRDLALELPVAGLHVDAVRGAMEVSTLVARLPQDKILSLGIIDGRNIWATNLEAGLDTLEPAVSSLGISRLWLAPSCSMLHVPVDVEQETGMDTEVRSWLAFARQKLAELAILQRGLTEGRAAVAKELEHSRRVHSNRQNAVRTCIPQVRERVAGLSPDDARRALTYEQRAPLQQRSLDLPLFPTTSIGSFPQTQTIRRVRRDYRRGELTRDDYLRTMRQEIARVIRFQEDIGMDVLVHGEPERNDMVEYFGEQLDGYAFTRHGWVQSYGSRCVKPPIIYGDVQRPSPMTVDWTRYAQSLTSKPVKAMLTGPVTMLQWAFERDDQSREATALQIALALRDEIADLEAAGIGVIQVDEPAFREGLPLRRGEWNHYLEWAARAFRVATSGVADVTQIHTHMCYSEFNDIIEAIASLDADVITIETARSDMELLDAFERSIYPNEIGPGVYDIHSPRLPTVQEMVTLLEKAARGIPVERLWVNPDCGLKTRSWDEVRPALEAMVEAARAMRDQQPATEKKSQAKA
ncbi:5-methyltetrahydropteroyltriglutamate--homocysteine S-methyltransferase [Thioalkalivibrio sp. ALRh]|uniref:5-methyltetrahydropteroyltriglutamate-- homocysteine S-methyltransferase n=1 Tax=Thioalkalivibrio sp. ALRh TaxID=1266911 RepID=UPI00036AC946|nr:5-methyltetrahydropteroyltriglutamate--homocysteine S-methyltransferase [Thioalkalivibrio sp. ALRh]